MKKIFFPGKIIILVFVLMFIALTTQAAAAKYYSVATGNWNSPGTWSLSSGGTPETINFPVAADDVVIEGGFTVTTTANAACNILAVSAGSKLTVGGFNFIVSGTTTVSGTLTDSIALGTKRHIGLVTINAGGIWNNIGNQAINFRGGLTNNGTFNAGTAAQIFNTNSQILTGIINIPRVTVNIITVTNTGILTCETALSGTGELINAASATLNIGLNSAIKTLTATAAGNTVNYYRLGNQTVKDTTTYNNLTLSGSGNKIMANGISVTGILNIVSAAKAALAAGVNIAINNLQFNSVDQVAGTWGSSVSSATNKTNTYFAAGANTGILTVGLLPVFTYLTASQGVCNGTTTITLSGTVSAGGVFPVIGEAVNVTINGVLQSTTISTGTGGFTLTYNTSSIPVSATPYTITYAYSGNLTLAPATDASTTLTVNALPADFFVTGGGSYCSGGSGMAVGLSGSQSGVNYQLKLNNVNTGTPVAGTGYAISFGSQTTTGTYTVIAVNSSSLCSITMINSVVVNEVFPPTSSAGSVPAFAVVNVPCLLSDASATNYTSLQWSVLVGTGSFDDATILHPKFTGTVSGETVTLQLKALNGSCPFAVSTIQLVMVPYATSKTWNGGTPAWELSTNWTPEGVPVVSDDVIIPDLSIDPIINSTTVCNNLTIEADAVLTINPGKSHSVGGTLINNAGTAGLIVKSGGSLIENSGVNATVERAISAWTTYGGWHLLSSPVSSQAISPNFTDPTPENYDFYAWSEPLNTWLNQKITENNITSFVPGTGYLVAYASSSTKEFKGMLNTSNRSFSGLTKSAGANGGWHLLGNPFPSAIAWGTANWSLSNITFTAKVWNESQASYKDIAQSAAIPAMNGFMVETTGGGSLTIPTAARTHSLTPWYKSSEGEEVIKLVAHDIDYSTAQESIIKVDASATEGFDTKFDSHFLAGFAPSFYSTAGAEKLSTNALPEISSNRIIPMSFTKNAASNFSIELVENNISGVSSLFLTDKKAGIVTDLNETPVYNFTASDSDDANRFELSFLDVTGVTKPDSKETFTVYQSKGNINITSQSDVNTEILVTNLVGQVVMRGKTNGNSLTTLDAGNLQNGVYVVSLVGNGKKVSKKLVVSK